MTGKMSLAEKLIEALALAFIILTVTVKSLAGVSDMGTLVMLAFVGIVVFVIFLVCAFFPADWRLTDQQRAKIKDLDAYQNKYRKIFVGMNFVFSAFVSLLIIAVVK